MIALYASTRAAARQQSTWALRRFERRARRRAGTGGRIVLGSLGLMRWMAVRSELRARGVRLPDPEVRPRWWQR